MCYLDILLLVPTSRKILTPQSMRVDQQIQIVHVAICLELFESHSNISRINKVNIFVLAK